MSRYPVYGPCLYPDDHPGWLRLMDGLADALNPMLGGTTVAAWDGRHIPLRWRLLVRYRDQGEEWASIGRVLGISPQAACQAYARWKPRDCCSPLL